MNITRHIPILLGWIAYLLTKRKRRGGQEDGSCREELHVGRSVNEYGRSMTDDLRAGWLSD